MKFSYLLMLCSVVCGVKTLDAQSQPYAVDAPRPIPLTRPELKQFIEDVKFRTPRIPLPELTDADRQVLGEQVDSYESRLKYHFLGEAVSGLNRGSRGGGPRPQQPDMTLDNGFKVELFWIVSRTNNCQYCLGHQESKLLGAGRSESRIAALDCDWSAFTPAEQAAFAFARKFTFEPQLLTATDIDALGVHFNKLQILEMCLSMAWNNSINRWKEGVGVPQNSDEGGYSRMAGRGIESSPIASDPNLPRGTYLTPTPVEFQEKLTSVAPVWFVAEKGQATNKTKSIRQPLESSDFVLEQLHRVTQRESRLPLVDAAQTKSSLGLGEVEVQNWMRLLANFPAEGKRRAQPLIESTGVSELSPLLQAQLRWIVARQDRAWYATAHAWKLLRGQQQNQEQIFDLDGSLDRFTPREQALYLLAKNLATSPVVLTDTQVGRAVELAGPAATVQTINFVSQLAAFNRLTEAAGLPFESAIP